MCVILTSLEETSDKSKDARDEAFGLTLCGASVLIASVQCILEQRLLHSNKNLTAQNLIVHELVWKMILMSICVPFFTRIQVKPTFDSSGYFLEFEATWKEFTSNVAVYMIVISIGVSGLLVTLSAVWIIKHRDAM